MSRLSLELHSGRDVPHSTLNYCHIRVRGENSSLTRSDIAVAGWTLILHSYIGGGKGSAKIGVECPTINVDGETAEDEIEVFFGE